MFFPQSFLEDLRNRLATSSVVGKRVRLVRKGREFHGLCPFHNEKTPSFTVNDAKGFYHCFGCGAHGDAIKFVMESGGLGYVEAITQLAGEVGMSLPKPDKRAEEREKKAASLYDILEMACRYYQMKLNDSREAKGYLQGREVSPEIVAQFRLGYAPEGNYALKQHLMQQGVTEEGLRTAGLVSVREDNTSYDKFRHRVIFPITDSRNRVIAFGGRILGEGQPKYLNSPETELFKKGELLYNLANARQASQGEVIVAEGYMDVIALAKAGFSHAVAPLGTAVTESQLHLLWRMAMEPVFCLDGDNAGKRAMVRAAMLALPHLKPGYSLKFCLLPKEMDPDDVIGKEGVEAMRGYLANALPLSEVLWRLETARRPATPEQKAALEQKLMDYANQIQDSKVRGHYRTYFQEKLWQWSRPAQAKKAPVKAQRLSVMGASLDPLSITEQMLLSLLLLYPALLAEAEVEDELNHLRFSDERLEALCTAMMEIKNLANANETVILTREGLHALLKDQGFSKEIALLLQRPQGILEEFLVPGIALGMVKHGWKRAVTLRNIAMMDKEKQQALQEITEESHRRASELTKQIEALRMLLVT